MADETSNEPSNEPSQESLTLNSMYHDESSKEDQKNLESLLLLREMISCIPMSKKKKHITLMTLECVKLCETKSI